jgi:glycosyltransferase involved in cell wall biosynthesis
MRGRIFLSLAQTHLPKQFRLLLCDNPEISMKRPKILIIAPGLGSGGAQKIFRDQFVFYSRHFETIGCVFNRGNALNEQKHLSLISLDVPAGSHLFSKGFFFLKRIIKLRQIKRSHDIDLSISHLEGADYVNILSNRGERMACYIHGSKFHDKEIKGLLGWLRRTLFMPILYRHADLIITVSVGIKDEFISKLRISPHKINVVTNGFDLKRMESLGREPIPVAVDGLLSQNKIICLCSRLAPQKNQEIFLSIFAHVRTKLDCKLVILGDGELRTRLINESAKLGMRVFNIWNTNELTDQFDIYFLGNQSNPFPYIIRSTVFALPSAWEGFPLALCEAMSCAIPVVASDCPTGPGEILHDRQSDSYYGFLLPVPKKNHAKDLLTWVETLIQIIGSRSIAKEYGEKAKRRVTKFSSNEMEKLWLNLVNDLMKK